MKFLKNNFYYLPFLSAFFFLGNPAKFPADDGFFYPQIAYNVLHYGFMGFNDLYLTNGFHPLWMVFCIIAEMINPFDKSFALYIVWFFQVSLFFFGFRFLEKTIFRESKIGKIIGLTFYCIVFFGLGTLYLTEAHLAFFTLTLLILYLCKNYTNDFVFGLICSFVFLARLDHIFIIIPFGFLYWRNRCYSIKSILIVLLGFSLLSIPYLVSNINIFGNAVPISGKIKSSFPVITDDIPFVMLTNFCIITSLLYFFFLLIYKETPFRGIKICFFIGSFIHLFYNLFYQSQIGQWYFVSQFTLFGFFIYDVFRKLNYSILNKNIVVNILTLILCGFLCGLGFLKLTTNISLLHNVFGNHSKLENKREDQIINVCMNLENIIPARSRIYVYDFPGKFAFYSHFNFIPSDGLVGNYIFFNDLDKFNFRDYLRQNKINYVLLPSDFSENVNDFKFMGIDVKIVDHKITYYIKNTLKNSITDSIKEQNIFKIRTYGNPVKTWQPKYDSVGIYKLK